MFYNFAWDNNKNEKNIKKHGVGLKAGITVFEDDFRIERYDEDNSDQHEDRYVTIGKDHRTNVLFVSYTMRDNENTVRLISVRKANSDEIRQYKFNAGWGK